MMKISLNHVIKKISRNICITILVFSPILGFFLGNDLMMVISPMDKLPWVHWNGIDPSNSAFISWETEEPSASLVQYDITPDSWKLSSKNETLVGLHRIKLVGLTPDTRYYYRVSNDMGTTWYASGTFQTGIESTQSKEFSFVITSDVQNFIGTTHYPRTARVISEMKNLSFFIIAGDLAEDHGQTSFFSGSNSRQPTWNDFWRYSNIYSPNLPIVPTPGNHDSANEPFQDNPYQHYFGISNAPNHNFYSFNWSRTQFVMVQVADGGDDGRNDDPDLPTFQQDQWINQTLAAGQSQDYRIMVFHRALFSSNGNDEGLINRFMPILVKYNVSFLFYGHEHEYERFYIQNRNLVCLGAGGGLLNGRIIPQTGRQISAVSPCITKLSLNATGITLTTLTPTMNIIESLHFTKEGSIIVPDYLVEN